MSMRYEPFPAPPGSGQPATEANSGGVPGYVPNQEHEKVCKRLVEAYDLIDALFGSGNLDLQREDMVKDFLGMST